MLLYDRVSPRLSSLLDLARWSAAWLVLVSHVRSLLFQDWSVLPPAGRGPLTAAFYLLTGLGHQAVMVFFVLSGFLVGGSVLNDLRRERFSLARYAINRVSRLYVVLLPALALGWLIDSAGSTWFAAEGIYSGHWPQPLAALQYSVVERLQPLTALASAANLQTIVAPPLGSNGPLWSLANEFWYYVLFPLLTLPLFLRGHMLASGACLVVAAAVAWLTHPEILAFGAVWLLGVLVRLCPWRLPAPLWLGGGVVVLAALTSSRLAHLDLGRWVGFANDVVLSLIFTVFLLSAMSDRGSAPLPGQRLSAALANCSYSLYLLHFPMLLLLCTAVQHAWGCGLSQPPGVTTFALFAGLTALLSAYAFGVAQLTERHTNAIRDALQRLLLRQPRPAAPPAT